MYMSFAHACICYLHVYYITFMHVYVFCMSLLLAHVCIYANFICVVHVRMCTCCGIFVLNFLNIPLLEDVEF